jgi:hypothetical protein
MLQQSAAQTDLIRFQNDEMGASGYALQQFLDVIPQAESQHDVQGPFPDRHISDEKPGFLQGIITAVKIEFAAVCPPEHCRGSPFGFGFNERDGNHSFGDRRQWHLDKDFNWDPEGVQQQSPGRKPWELPQSKELAL